MNAQTDKRVCVKDIACLLEQIAPSYLSEEWDNCGLQVGSSQWPVRKILVALDPLLSVIEDAGRQSADMVITHHPLIFKALKHVDIETLEGKVIAAALNKRIAIYAAHTNLDSAAGGINDVLAQKIGLCNLRPMVIAKSLSGSEVSDESTMEGIGRIGELAEPMTVTQWAGRIKNSFGLRHVKVAGNVEQVVHQAAVCSGSGSSLLDGFLGSSAEVFISGDMRYHDARAVEDAGRAFIDIGHFASEHIIIDTLVSKLTSAIQNVGWQVRVQPCILEKDPFELL